MAIGLSWEERGQLCNYMTDELLNIIKVTVEEAVDKKINGKLISISNHLKEQDETMNDLKVLLEDKKFLQQLWAFIKFLGGAIISLGTAYLLYRKILR